MKGTSRLSKNIIFTKAPMLAMIIKKCTAGSIKKRVTGIGMNKLKPLNNIEKQYYSGNLEQNIMTALELAGKPADSITLGDLSSLDELHIGGREATESLAHRAGLKPGMHVLDVGSGLGGPARLIASKFGCNVTGLDLTEEFCLVASKLTKLVKLDSKVTFRQGDALDMPFGNENFDLIWSQHCSMNILDKQKLFSEFSRVLKPGGLVVIHDIYAGPVQPIHFPVPWARDPGVSFLITLKEMRKNLKKSGLHETLCRDITDEAFIWFGKQSGKNRNKKTPLLKQQLVFGADLPVMAGNMKKNLQEKRIQVIESILKKGFKDSRGRGVK